MNLLQKLGLAIFCIALITFTLLPALSTVKMTEANLPISNKYHKAQILETAKANGLLDKEYGSSIGFIHDFKYLLKQCQFELNEKAKAGLPPNVGEWDYKLGDWKLKEYTFDVLKATSSGLVPNNKLLFLFLTFGLGTIGGLMYILPKFSKIPGIKNDHIFHSSMTRGLTFGPRSAALALTIVGTLIYGFNYMNGNLFWPIATAVITLLIIGLVLYYEKQKLNAPTKSASPDITGWLGLITGTYLIGFYIFLYWKPEYLINNIMITDPVSKSLSGNAASQWFLYGFLYTVIVLVMGIRMMSKYMHNKYQLIRTGSVMFFQTAFAFLIPEILVRMNQPWYDFKNMWPLDYDFFFDWNINQLINSGGLGIFMLVWGILLFLVGVPVITYFYGKRWYCSWVCGCGGLAETLGDPYRQLSDKSLRAWKFERWIIHGVLVFSVFMTILVLIHFFTGNTHILFFNSDTVRSWYGFLIGSAFAGIVGTGFYPLMGNRTWCRFGCPLAAYLGLVQRFKSRFRITTNGGQCISCGNCSTHCEMGIDVRAYAQKGQNIVRSSCVGCGVCAAVCPRGVLRLENGSTDIGDRTTELKAIHIAEGDIRILS